ncbi:MAG: hypothetical protein JXA01_05995 [Dehalococcoidia bacterium]|nr:hypothetical protein [Dehalococcoidia bacterium]
MKKAPMVHEHCKRCLAGKRWNSSALLMVIDAAFDSIGLNYFQSVVPKVDLFRQQYVETGKIRSLDELVDADDIKLREIWKNCRSWKVAKEIARCLVTLKNGNNLDDRAALIMWAKNARLDGWEKDPIGSINGVGINTYQYLRMMGGVDTVMPDKIVKRVLYEIFNKANIPEPASDLDFILLVENLATRTGYRAIELCWMTWLIQSEAGLSRTEKYASLLPQI